MFHHERPYRLQVTGNPVTQVSQHREFDLVRPSLFTGSDAFAVLPNTLGPPQSTGAVEWLETPAGLLHEFRFFGKGSDGDTLTFTILGAAPVLARNTISGQKQDLWMPARLVTVTATLGTLPGLAGHFIDENMLFADAITIDTDESIGPLNARKTDRADSIASLYLDLTGIGFTGVHGNVVDVTDGIGALVRAI